MAKGFFSRGFLGRRREVAEAGRLPPGFWESLGYHNYGDPWKEQRYQGD